MTLEDLLKETPPMQIHAVVKGFQAGMETRGKQVIELRQHVKLLREFVKLLRDYIPASAVGNTTVQEALDATEPKP